MGGICLQAWQFITLIIVIMTLIVSFCSVLNSTCNIVIKVLTKKGQYYLIIIIYYEPYTEQHRSAIVITPLKWALLDVSF